MAATNRFLAVGTATYVVVAPWRNQAMCGCGWRGKKRLLRGVAVSDALEHCACTKHGLS
jgi:hypothetical protein